MKNRLWSGLLAACLLASMLAATILPVSANAPTTGEIWSVYTLTEDEKGLPHYGTIPRYEYAEDGLYIEPVESADFTVQSDHTYDPAKGLFMEIRVEDAEVFQKHNQLVFHLWNQSGVIVGYDRAGSGFYGLISALNGEHYLICMGILEKTGSADSDAVLFCAIKLQPRYTADGKLVYTLAVKDNGVYVNGERLEKSQEIMAFLKQVTTDGKVHVGATVCCREGEPATSVTVTRFGLKEATAVTPGTAVVPDTPTVTLPAEPDTQPDPETQPSDENETPAPDVGDQTDETPSLDVTTPAGEETDLSQTEGVNGGNDRPDGGEPDGGSAGDDDGESDTLVPGDMAQDVVELFQKINPFQSCQSSLSWSGITALTVMLLAAVMLTRKREH